jgi:hypothetical protein
MIRRFAAALLLLFAVPAFAATHSASSSRLRPVVTYDTSIGNGVDAKGFASLPLRAGANRYYVRSGVGDDTNTCVQAQSPSTPKATIASAITCVTDSNGDQLLVAEGTSYSEGLPNMCGKRGFSAVYPTVLQSYDPADPTNEAKLGRATANRPVVDTGAAGMDLGSGGGACGTLGSAKMFAIRGFVVDPGSASPGLYISVYPAATGTNDYVLFENNIFRYTEVFVDDATSAAGLADHFILRNNSFYGSWDASTSHGAGSQGAYADNISHVTFEDNVFWHNGYEIGASRDAATSSGGLVGDEVFRHAYYINHDCRNAVSRRNLIIDGPADGGQNRSHTLVQGNLYIDNPTAVALGGGPAYNIAKPLGVDLDFASNVIIGSQNLTTALPRGTGIISANGRPTSIARYNLLARSALGLSATGTTEDIGFGTGDFTSFNLPNYMTWDHNTVYLWSDPSVQTSESGPGATFATYTNNIWDKATSGSNVVNTGVTFTYAHTAAQLYAALGFADKTALINYAIAHPEAHIQRLALSQLQSGYGIRGPPLGAIAATINPAQGTADSSIFVGTKDGSTLSATGLPTGLTIDSPTRSWTYNGVAAAASGTFPLTETWGGTTRTTTISYNIAAPPVLTSGTATAINSTSATVGATTDTGSGKLYFVVTTSSTQPSQAQIVAGQDATGTSVAAGRSGFVTVTSTGAKTATANGLSPSTSGYFAHLVQQGGAGNWSNRVSSGTFSTPAQTLGSELLTNGTFAAAAPPPTLASGVTITSGHATVSNGGQLVTWSGVLTSGNLYRVSLDYNCTSGAKLRVNNSATNGAAIMSTSTTLTCDSATHTITFADFIATGADLSIEADSATYSGWIDNVSAKQVI